MRIAALLLLGLAAGAPAAGQTVGPEPAGAPAREEAPRRFEAAFVYGFAVFTATHGDAAWYEGAPAGGRMDLQTTPSLGLGLAWAPGDQYRLGVRATRQATRLEVTEDGVTGRTDLTLLHLQLAAERAFGGGRSRPVLGLAAGAVRASADGAGTWHYAVTPEAGLRFAADPRVVLRLVGRVPLVWANGTLVAQVEAAGGVAVPF